MATQPAQATQATQAAELEYLQCMNSFISARPLSRLLGGHISPLEAVIVEPRCHAALEGVLCNFAHFLPNASFTIYHSDENETYIHDILAKSDLTHNDAIKLVNFRSGNMGREDYNDLLKSPDFWNARTGERTLIFQTDTGLRKNSIAQYWDYAFVGAPWTWTELGDPFFQIGNGGLSLRDTQFSTKFAATPSHLPEDVHFSYGALYAQRIPSVKVASSFSMEYMYHPDPMGYHQAYRLAVHSQKVRDELLQHYMPIENSLKHMRIIDAWIENSRDGRIYAVDGLKGRLEAAIGPSGLELARKTRMWPANIDGGAINAQPKKLVFKWDGGEGDSQMMTVCPLDPKLRVPVDLRV